MHRCLAFIVSLFLLSTPGLAEDVAPLEQIKGAKRIVFLGDSITAAGQYVAAFDAWLVAQRWERTPTVIDCGLPSETVSGLSEEGHAGGQFPRPDLHERLDRVLKLTKPDVVIACYGMNCGIYQPLDDDRFARYQAGIKQLKAKVEAAGAKLILVTPPLYDAHGNAGDFNYDDVLGRYSEWLLEQRKAGWAVIDLHGPMKAEVERRRQSDAKFTFQGDGVHPNDAGHWFIAQQLIAACDDASSARAETPEAMAAVVKLPAAALPLISHRMSVLRDAYVSAAGHKRPGVAQGLPVEEAEKQAAELTAKIKRGLEVQ